MKRVTRTALLQIVVILALGGGMAWAGSQGSVRVMEVPLFALCGAFSFGINWVAFVPAYVAQTEKFFDQTGTLSYLSLVAVALIGHPYADPRAWMLAFMISVCGPWAWSRHPNYFGEILLWFGIAVAAYPALSGWSLAALVSPLFVFLLLTRVSGVPLLEDRGNRKWGEDPEYQAYKERTPVLMLRIPV